MMAQQIGSTDTPQLDQKAGECPFVDRKAWPGREMVYESPQRPKGVTPSKTLGVAIVVLTLVIALIIAFVR